MSEVTQPKTAAAAGKAAAPKKGHAPDGVWVTYEKGDEEGTYRNVSVFTSEINALRVAVNTPLGAIKVTFGSSLDEAIADKESATARK